jgi:hypothetical protein
MTWTQSLDAAAQYVQGLIADVTGIRSAPTAPRDLEAAFPASVCFPRSGRFENPSSGLIIGYHTLVIQIHYPRVELSRAYTTIVPYLEKIAEVLIDDPTLGATVTTIVEDIQYSFGQMAYGEVPTLGWQFEVTVKVSYTESS